MTGKYKSVNNAISNAFSNFITGLQNKRNKVIDPIGNITQSSVSASVLSSVSPLFPTSSGISGPKLDSFIRKTTKMKKQNIDF